MVPYSVAMAVTLQQLEVFRSVARNLSFSVAAKELYTSQPHVSNQIRKLEEHYRVPLFVRSRPGISLTEAGAALYERINSVLDQIDETERVVEQFRGLRRGSVTIAATASAGSHLLPRALAKFHDAHPDVVVRMDVSNTEDVLGRVLRDEADLAITPRPPDTTDLVSVQLYSEDLVVISPAGLGLPEEISQDLFASLPLVVREEGSLTLTVMDELLAEREVEYVAHLGGTTAVNEAVAAGLGVSLVPEHSTRSWVHSGAVRISRLAGTTLRHHFHVVHSAQRYLTPAAKAAIGHLQSWVHSEGATDHPT